MTSFQVGQKVVCINDVEQDFESPVATIVGGMDGLRKGAIYTIREVYADPFYGEICIRLREIQRIPFSTFGCLHYEAGYDPERFRPIVERKTDISQFKALLNPSKVEEVA